MEKHQVRDLNEAEALRLFTRKLLGDLRALERMLEEDLVESGARRIGSEQEMFLVDRGWRPAPVALKVLETLDDPCFTTELGLFNLEVNLEPIDVTPDALSRMETQVRQVLQRAAEAAAVHDARVLLTGILPTVAKSDLNLGNMTPKPRYHALNEAMHRLRGEQFHFRIKGRDELISTHDNVMLEACNTSFQVHFQVSPSEFARWYNVAQAVAAPVLAAAANSPLLFGRILWRETRIALFQQSVDDRAPKEHLREQTPRVSFGDSWVDDSVMEIFREDVARFRVILSADIDEDPRALLDRGEVPTLPALRLHNGTVYRWNRPCYGIYRGRPHLRIENRVLPSGPTPVDEVANAAFWFGLVRGALDEYGDPRTSLRFGTVRENFIAAARLGLGAQFNWIRRENVPAQDLILEELLPLAHHGLEAMGISSENRERYLGILQERVSGLRTGAQWLIDSLDGMGERGTRAERLAALTAATWLRQQGNSPVHTWDRAALREAGGWQAHYNRVDQIMTTDLFTVNQDELVDLVAHVMRWKHVRHVPVEDSDHRLVGLVTQRAILRMVSEALLRQDSGPVPVSRIMQTEIQTATPEMTTLEAIRKMRRYKVGCLPVVSQEQRLVGMITERDLMKVAGDLLEEILEEERT